MFLCVGPSMRNLLLLIVIVLAGGAGWYGGSWKGRDAIQALAKVKEVGQQAQAEHDKAVQDLKQSTANLLTDYQKGQKARDAAHAREKSKLDAELANRDKTIAALRNERQGKQTEIERIEVRLAGTTFSEERLRLRDEIARLKKDLAEKQAQIDGFECTKMLVPAQLLTPLQGRLP